MYILEFLLDSQLLLENQVAAVAGRCFAQIDLLLLESFPGPPGGLARGHSYLHYLLFGLLQGALHGAALEDHLEISTSRKHCRAHCDECPRFAMEHLGCINCTGFHFLSGCNSRYWSLPLKPYMVQGQIIHRTTFPKGHLPVLPGEIE